MTDRGGKVAGGEVSGGAAEPFRDILVVDLLGGIGDLIMALPMVHCLARRNPGATLRVLTHEPAADLVRGDPAVAEVHVPRYGRPNAERVAVADALAARRPDLAVTTTRFDGIPGLLAACGARCVTDLWRRPPPEEPVGKRYLRILADEGLLDAADVHAVPRVSLRTDELAAGAALLAERLRAAGAHHPRALANKDCGPVVFVPESGMAVKQWPASRWRQLSARVRADGHAVLAVSTVSGLEVATLPRVSLRQLAAVFAAVAVRDGVVVGGGARCGWQPPRAHGRSAFSAPPWQAGTASAVGRICRGYLLARTGGRPRSPNRFAGGTPNARCRTAARPAWTTSAPMPWSPPYGRSRGKRRPPPAGQPPGGQHRVAQTVNSCWCAAPPTRVCRWAMPSPPSGWTARRRATAPGRRQTAALRSANVPA